MQCPECRHENPIEARFCMKCGTGLGEGAASATAAKAVKPKGEIWKSYDLTDGLPAGAICLYQDAAGYLWIGTWGGGVSVFDGQKFVT